MDCQGGAGSSAERLRFPFPGVQGVAGAVLQPQQGGRNVLFSHLYTCRSGWPWANLQAGKKKRSYCREQNLFIIFKKCYLNKRALGLWLPRSSLLIAAIQANLFVGKGGRRGKCCSEHSYPQGARVVRAPALAWLGMVEVLIQDLTGTNQCQRL